MADDARLDAMLACPRCDKAPLERSGSTLKCGGCKTEFPSVSGMPWLFADPEASLGEWRNRLHLTLQTLLHEVQRLKDALGDKDLRPLARRRLELLMSATEQHRNKLRALLAPIDVQSLQAAYTTHLALRTRLPGDQGLYTYYNNVHRDWCWGEAESAASVEQILDVLGASEKHDAVLGNTVVLGAGAGRLAYDLHQLPGTGKTIAVDFNPLLLIIAQSIARGDRIDLYEFPIAPRSLDDFAVLRTLSAPEPARDDFFLVLGDVLRPPLAAATFDTIVTPWLIDIITEDLPDFAARVNRLLKPGGRWLNFGSLSFEQQTDRRRRYSSEEILALVGEAGFGPPEVREATIPYMCSPASRHGRRETVFTFCAEKLRDTTNPSRHKALPDWLVTGREPVPLLPSFQTQAMSTKIYAFIMSLIDGKRSIADMAKVLEHQQLMTRAEAEPAIRNFLTRMYDDSQRQTGF